MSKKMKRDDLLAAVTDLADRLGELDEELSVREIGEALGAGGVDVEAVWGRFQEAARNLESELWAEGKKPSRGLPSTAEPSRSPCWWASGPATSPRAPRAGR